MKIENNIRKHQGEKRWMDITPGTVFYAKPGASGDTYLFLRTLRGHVCLDDVEHSRSCFPSGDELHYKFQEYQPVKAKIIIEEYL